MKKWSEFITTTNSKSGKALVNTLMLQLFIPLSILGSVYRQLQYSLADMDLVIKLLDRTPEIVDTTDAQALQLKQGTVHFNNVDFHYNDDRQILHGVDFKIPAGQKLARLWCVYCFAFTRSVAAA